MTPSAPSVREQQDFFLAGIAEVNKRLDLHRVDVKDCQMQDTSMRKLLRTFRARISFLGEANVAKDERIKVLEDSVALLQTEMEVLKDLVGNLKSCQCSDSQGSIDGNGHLI